MAQRVDNTMVEFLQKLLKDIAMGKLLPDADMPFLVTLENTVLDRAKQPVDQMRQQGVLPPAQGQPMGNMTSMQGPNMAGASDEMARMMGPSQGPQ